MKPVQKPEAMPKKEYYRKSVLCSGCAFHRPEGKRPDAVIDKDAIWPEACGLYGYSFFQELEPAPECEGFRTPAQHAADIARKEQERKIRKRRT